MKSLKSKVALSAIVLLFALVATIGSTFAWFTVTNTVTASSIQLTVQSQDSLLMKVAATTAVPGDAGANKDATAYTTTLTGTLIDDIWTAMVGAKLGPVTAVQATYASVSADPANFLTLVTANTNPTRALAIAPNVNSTAGGVIQFKLWVMSQASTTKDLYMSAFSVTGTGETGVNTLIQNTVRMAVSCTNVSGYDLLYSNSGAVDYDYIFTSANASTFYSGTVYDPISPFGLLGFNRIDQLTMGLDGVSPALTASALATQTNTYGTLTNASVLTQLATDTPQLLTFTIYIEGWDKDMTNSLANAPFTVLFSLSI